MGAPWVERTAADFAQAIAGELPTGAVWPRDPSSDLMKWVDGCAQIWGDVEGRAADLLVTETDPRFTLEMLPDWESAFGLPDPCVAEPLNLVDRHKALLNKMTTLGGQSRAFFIATAAALGYAITITEYSPFMCGLSRVGDTRPAAPTSPTDVDYRWSIAPPEIRFWWRVHIIGAKTRWFRMGSGQCGIDPMVRIGLATDLECVLRRWKPAQTDIVFDYGNGSTQFLTYTWFRAGLSHLGQDPLLTIVSNGSIQDS